MKDGLFINDQVMVPAKAGTVFLRILLPFILGIITFYDITNPSSVYLIGTIYLVIFSFLVLANLYYKRLKIYKFKSWLACLTYLFLFIFGAFASILNKQCLSENYFKSKQQDYLRVSVCDEPQLKSGILRFKANVSKSYSSQKNGSLESISTSGKLMVSTKTDSLNPIELAYGDELIISAKVTSVAAPYNPAEFDYRSWLAAQNIYHQVFLKQGQLVKLNENSGNPIIAFALALRAKQVQFYRKLLKDDDAFAVASTLILGYRSDLSEETLGTYSKTGTIHALSVSGMHVGLIYMVLNWLLQYLDRNRLLKIGKVALIFILIWFYALLTGFSPSVLRSAIMLSVYIIARSFNRQSNSYNIISFAAFCLLVYDPFLIWDVGFQLSFLAVLGLIYLQPKMQNWWHPQNKWISKLWGIITMSLAAQLINLTACMYLLAIFSIIITLGGMKVIGYTDVIQVFFLILGGLATTYLALELVATHFGSSGVMKGFSLLKVHAEEHFHMIFKKDNENYLDLPGLTVLIGGMWIVNLNYWGCNQYITQRALGADLKTARNGLLFASFLKLLMPVIVVLPGIAAFVLYKEGYGDFKTDMMQGGEVSPDSAYPVLLNLLPAGLKGLSFAALTAAVVASLAGKANSIATIFTLDIYKKVINKTANEDKQVVIGRITVILAMLVAIVISPLLGIDKKGGFQFIQEYTGFFSPGIFAMFILGFFWKKTTSNAALFATVGGFALSVIFKFLPNVMNLEFLSSTGFSKLVQQRDGNMLYEIPFLDRMGFVFIICLVVMYIISIIETRRGVVTNGLEIEKEMFSTNRAFTVGAIIVCGLIVALYTIYW